MIITILFLFYDEVYFTDSNQLVKISSVMKLMLEPEHRVIKGYLLGFDYYLYSPQKNLNNVLDSYNLLEIELIIYSRLFK